MLLIQHLTSDPRQTQILLLPGGDSISMTIYFRPQQYGWFIQELAYQDFLLHEMRITNSPNMLHQFRNKLPFGLACFSIGNREPSQQQDFSAGVSSLYVLTADEVQEFTELLQGG